MAKRSSPRRPRRSRPPSGSVLRRDPRGASDRIRRPQDLLRGDLSDRERVVEQIYQIVFQLARDLGLNALSARRAFQRAEKSANSPYRLREALRYQAMRQLSEILGAWYREPALLDERGDPRPLPLTGVKSFATLAHRFLPGFSPRDIADTLITERLLRRNPSGDVVPLRRSVRFRSNSTLMLERIPALLHDLTSTLRHNAGARPQDTLCERGTTIDRLPVEAVPAYNDYVKQLAHTLLDQTDTWGSQRQASEGVVNGRRLARVGVEVYAYVEDENTPKRGKRA
jgi:hypothetical protein